MGAGAHRVLVVEDHPIFRDGVVQCLQAERDFTVVGTSDGIAFDAARFARLVPDLVLMDIELPERGGIELTREMRAARPDARVVMLTGFADADLLFGAMQAGAVGYLLKHTAAAELVTTLRRVATRAGGPLGFAAASLSTLTLHFILRRLSDTRLESERQRAALLAMQDELARRERLATIGQTASSVLHQIARHHGAVGMYAHLLAREGDGPEGGGERFAATVREHASRIAASIEEANHVIDELLRFGQDRTLHVYPCSLAELVSECVTAVAPQAETRGVRLEVTHADDVVVPMDKRKLAQVLDNLLDNAIEASPAGTRVELTITHGDGEAQVAVRDHGPGVAAQVRDRLFTPFCTTKPDGIGLGLALARELAEAHGGRVRHEPAERGALFVLDLPLAARGG